MNGARVPPIFGMRPADGDAAAIVARIVRRRRRRQEGVGLVATANIDHVARLVRDPAFAAAYRAAEIVTCDGFPVAAYARLRGWRTAGRVTGCAIAARLLRGADLARHRLFFVVDSAATRDGLLDWARRRRVLAQVEITVAPPRFGENADHAAATAARIAAHRTTLLLLGVGAPRSEVFVHQHRHLLPPCWALCVGQALRIEAGVSRPAPATMQALNLEWLWRITREPERLAARYATAVAGFAAAVLRDIAGLGHGPYPVDASDAVTLG